jgi:FkbM family methyltransferase
MPDKVHDIKVSTMRFKMNFCGAETSPEIVQRMRGVREPMTTAILGALVRPGDQVMEIGSCFGYFTLQLSEFVKPGGRVLSIESMPGYFALLKRNCELNDAQNVVLNNVCVCNDPTYRGHYNEAGLPVMRASTLLGGYSSGLIFMDIEGWEADVIEDLAEAGFFEHNPPKLVWETHGRLADDRKDRYELAALLKEHGYTTRWLWKLAVSLPGKGYYGDRDKWSRVATASASAEELEAGRA